MGSPYPLESSPIIGQLEGAGTADPLAAGTWVSLYSSQKKKDPEPHHARADRPQSFQHLLCLTVPGPAGDRDELEPSPALQVFIVS